MRKPKKPDVERARKQVRDINAANRKFWEKRNADFDKLAATRPTAKDIRQRQVTWLKRALDDALCAEQANRLKIDSLMSRMKGRGLIEDSDVKHYQQIRRLLREGTASAHARVRLEVAALAHRRKRTKDAADKRNEIGDDVRSSIKKSLGRLGSKTGSNRKLAEEIRPMVNKDPEYIRKVIATLKRK